MKFRDYGWYLRAYAANDADVWHIVKTYNPLILSSCGSSTCPPAIEHPVVADNIKTEDLEMTVGILLAKEPLLYICDTADYTIKPFEGVIEYTTTALPDSKQYLVQQQDIVAGKNYMNCCKSRR